MTVTVAHHDTDREDIIAAAHQPMAQEMSSLLTVAADILAWELLRHVEFHRYH